MPSSFPRQPFPVSTTILVLGWLAIPLLMLPPARQSQAHTSPLSSMAILHRTVEPGPELDALCRDPAVVTRPSLIDDAIRKDMQHILPDAVSTRRLRPTQFLDLTDSNKVDGAINSKRFTLEGTFGRHPVVATHSRTDPVAARQLAPFPVIEYDSLSQAHNPETSSLPSSLLTNYPWSVTVSVSYNSKGTVEHAFLSTPSRYPLLNEAALRAARTTRLSRAPGTQLSGEIRFRCLVGIARQENP